MMSFVRQPAVTPPPPFEENPIHEAVTYGLVGMFGVDDVDLVSDRSRDGYGSPAHLRRERLLTGWWALFSKRDPKAT